MKNDVFKKVLFCGVIIFLAISCCVFIISGEIESTEFLDNGAMIFNPTNDTFVTHSNPDDNSGYQTHLKTKSQTGWEKYSLIRFNISSLSSGTVICSAKLKLYYYDYNDSNPSGHTLNLYKINENWDEDIVTWNNQPSHDGNVSTFSIIPSTYGIWLEWDVTLDVQDYVNGSIVNYGWKIIDNSSSSSAMAYFCSKEYGSYIPYLEIEFANVYVDDDADPSWYDTTHVRTIQDGINNASSGNTVFVYNGNYFENVIVNKTVNLIGEDRNSTIIDGGSRSNIINISADRVNVSRFRIQNCIVYSIYLGNSNYCKISENIITDNDVGLVLYNSSNNIIFENDIFNSFCGLIAEVSSNNNLFYHNNFDNTFNVMDYCDNFWDDGYPSGGNYWSDYTGLDSNGDGIGDIPYDISGGYNQDLHPLIHPYGITYPPTAQANGPYYGEIGDTITFSAVGSIDNDEGGSSIEWYRWDFDNDGTFDTGWLPFLNPLYDYSYSGTYQGYAILQIKDNDGQIDNDTARVDILEYPDIIVKMTKVNVTECDNGSGYLNIYNIINLGSCDLKLSWNPNIVKMIYVGDSDFDNMNYYVDNSVGILIISAFSYNAMKGNITIAKLTFEPAFGANTGEWCNLVIASSALYSIDVPPFLIPHTIKHGKSYIRSCVPGDMDGSGSLNSADTRYLALHIVGKPGYEELQDSGDVNCNNLINAADCRYLACYLVGKPGYETLYWNC